MTARPTLGALLIAACAQTPAPEPETAAAKTVAVQWDEAVSAELDAYGRTTFEAWLNGNASLAQAGVADDTALLYDMDPGGMPVRLVGPEAIGRFAADLAAHIQKHDAKGTIEAQTCRATVQAGVCTTEFKVEVPLPDGQALTLRRRGTCLAARAHEEWRWTHCHISLAERPDASGVKLSSASGNKDDLVWEKSPAGFDRAVVWQDPLTGHHAAFVRFPVAWGDSERHYHDATALAAVIEGKVTHWSEGGTMYEVAAGGFGIISGGEENAHTSEFDEGTIAFAVFDKPMNRISTADAEAARERRPPAGEAPWDEAVTAELEAFSRAEMAKWEEMDVDGIAATQLDIGLPAYMLDMEGKPTSARSAAEQVEMARKMAAAGMTGSVDIQQMLCRGTKDFGWCAIDYDFSATGPDGKPMTLSFRGTGVAARHNGGWKNIHWHGSLAKIPGPPAPKMSAVDAEEMTWEDLPGASGAQIATVWEDPASGTTAAFIKVGKKWKGMPNHSHSHDMLYAVLRGTHTSIDKDGTKRVARKGGWGFEPAKHVHRTEAQEGTLLFIVTDGPLDSVMADGK